jgi:hypothetical protein
MWGADLDDEDRRALKQDLARRAGADVLPSEPSEPSVVIVNGAG